MAPETTLSFLPDRLNGEPVVYRGLTTRELGLLAASAVALWLPASLLILGLAGYFMMGFGIGALLALATVWTASGYIQAVKRGKPSGYHVVRLEFLFHDLKLKRSPYIRYTGTWDIRRRRPQRGAGPLRDAAAVHGAAAMHGAPAPFDTAAVE